MNLRSILRQPVLTVAFHARDARWSIGGRGRVVSTGRVLLPPGSLSDGVIVDPEATGTLLRQEPSFPGSVRMQVALALPAQRTLFRMLELPALKGKHFDEMVAREIRREMPMLAENAYVAWKRLDEAPGTTARVFLVGSPRDIVDSHAAAARAAGLHPQSADLRVIAAARAVGSTDCVIANVEDDEAEIAIFRDGLPVIVRHVTLGTMGGDSEWGAQLAEELARTLKFYRDTHRDDPSAHTLPIDFVGDAAARALRTASIADTAGRSVEVPALRLVLSPASDSASFAANVGLALKDIAA